MNADDDDATSLPTVIQIILEIGLIVMMTVGMVGNSILCILVYQKRSMRSPINLLLATFAFSDFLQSAICMPVDLATLVDSRFLSKLDILCEIHAFVESCLLIANAMFLLAISADRYCIIVKKRSRLTPCSCYAVVTICAIYAIGLSLGPLVGWSSFTLRFGQTHCQPSNADSTADRVYILVYFFLAFLFPFGAMSYAYYGILKVVRGNRIRVGVVESRDSNRRDISNATVKFKTRTFTTILMLFVTMFSCRLPHSVFQLVSSYRKRQAHSFPFVFWIVYLNCALNPVIYAVRVEKYRQLCRRILHSCFPKLDDSCSHSGSPSTIYRI